MMQINESIAGEILIYDYDTHTWKEIAQIDDSNVVNASTKRQCCADGAFEIGGVYGASLSLTFRLTDITRNQLRSSRIVLRSKYAQEDDWEPVGVFYVTRVRAKGDVYTVTAEDGMLWTDTDYVEGLLAEQTNISSDRPLDGYLDNSHITRYTGSVIPLITSGMDNVAEWANFDEISNGSYCNEYLCSKVPVPCHVVYRTSDGKVYAGSDGKIYQCRSADGEEWRPTSQIAIVKCCATSSGYKSGCARDFYRWAAELAGGFVTVGRDGRMCLRQFGMDSLGEVEVSTSDIEWNSADISDFQLWLQSVRLIPEVTGVDSVDFGMKEAGEIYDFDYKHHATLQYKIESNPLLDGLCARYVSTGVLTDAQPFAAALWRSFFNSGRSGDRVLQIRPFRATVHKPARFELGQRIVLHYWDVHETEETTYQSTITSVEWTFRGGHKIACGGENARMTGGRVLTKSDRTTRELLYRTR